MVHPSRCSRIVALVSLATLFTCASARAQLVFSTASNISKNQDYSFTPQVAVDPLGHIYAVWEDDTATNSNILCSRSTDGGLNFSACAPVSNSTGLSTGPRLAVDAQGNINVVWLDNTPGVDEIFFSRSGDGGATFTPAVNLSNGMSSTNPQVAVDGQGNIHVLWETPGVGTFYRNSGNGGASFSAPINLASTSTMTSVRTAGSRLNVGSNGNVYVVWQALAGGLFGVYFSASSNGGGSFSSPMKLSNPDTSFAPQVAVDGSGNINVIWVDSGTATTTMLFSRSTDQGATFSTPKMVASPGIPFTPQMQADPAGNIYIVWYQSTPADIFFTASADGGATFSAAMNISNAGSSSKPLLAVDSSGNLNVSWLHKTTTPQVFFSQSTDHGATFSAPQNLSSDSGTSLELDMIADSTGGLELVWSDDASSINQIMFSRLGKPNQPPVANAGANQTLNATSPSGASVTLDGSASTDPDGDALTFVWTEGSTVVGNSAVVSLTASIGTHIYTLTVTDTAGLSASASTQVTVNPQPPVANAGANQNLTATSPSGATVSLNGSLSSDPNGYALTFVWTEGSTVVGNSAVVSLTASIGTHIYTLTVTDTAGLSASSSTQVTVNPRPPLANAGANQTLTASGPSGATVSLNGSLSSDPNGYALTFVWTEGSTVVGNSAVVSLTASIGTHTYTLTVTDTAGLSASATTQVTVNPRAPVANAGANQTVTASGPTGATVSLNGSLSNDPNGYALSYVWTEGSTVVGNSAVVSLTASIGTHTYTLTVTDTAGLSASATTQVTVNPRPPVANAGANQTVTASGPSGATVSLNGSLSNDPNGYALSYVWTEGSNVVGNSAVVSLTASIGTHTYTLTVTDTAGLSASSSTQVTVNPQPPVANAGANQTVTATSASGATVTLNGSLSSDPNGYALSYVWTEGSTVVGKSAVVSLTASIGTHTYTLTVTDTAGLSASATTQVSVNPRPPVANAGANQAVTATSPSGASVTLNGSLSYDPNGYALSYFWTEGSTVVGRSAMVTLTASIGTHTYTLTVTDTAGLSASAATQVTVNPGPPVAGVAADPVYECTGPVGTPVKLDGSASADPQGYALKYVWTDSTGKVVGTSAVVWQTVGLSTHVYTLTVTDSAGLSSKATTSITVQDTTPPTVALSMNTTRPTNNRLELVTIHVSDVCDASPKGKLVSIISNDPPDKGRRAVNDIEAVGGGPVAFGMDVRSFLLRAERPTNGARLLYTVKYTATDASGNTKTTTTVLDLSAR